MLGGNDLIIRIGNEEHGYVLNAEDPKNIVHTSESPNVPLNTGASTPTQAGGVYDVRDSAGDKAITHLDWSGGAGQKSLDTPDAAYSRFLLSKYVDTSIPGEISQQNPFTHVHYDNVAGPMFSALGKLWMGLGNGVLMYSNNDGVDWSAASMGATPPVTAIGGFASDGTNLYICCSGVVSGLWKWDGTGTPTFAKYSGITAALEKLAYNAGTLYGATGNGAGAISVTANGTYTTSTANFITGANSTVALVSTQNAVYWVVSKGDNSYVYKLYYDFTLSTPGVVTEQFSEFPTGFLATCALGYLGNVDVGGYFRSLAPAVGQGAVYRTNADGGMSVLFRVGERPEDTDVPTARENDNRIKAAVAGGLDTYWLTERELLRWDLRTGGYVHMGDFLGCGAPSRVVTQANEDVLPSGGDVVWEQSGKRYHIFLNDGNLVVPSHRDNNGNIVTTVPMDYLLVAGGAGGGSSVSSGGGGGGGGVLEGTQKLMNGTVVVDVGEGGAVATNGANTSITGPTSGDLTAIGGGKGGNSATAGTAGGSGGGAGIGTDVTPEVGGNFTSGQGKVGGDNEYYSGGGGVGAAGGGGGAGGDGIDGVEELA